MMFNWIYDIYLKKEDINNTYIRDTNILRVLILKKKKIWRNIRNELWNDEKKIFTSSILLM